MSQGQLNLQYICHLHMGECHPCVLDITYTYGWKISVMPEGEKIGGEGGSSKGTFLSYLQRDKHFIFLNLEIWILLTENCLEIEDVFKKFDSLEACKGKKATFGCSL